ncbi:hypothetical protein FNH06_00020 [Amycolatopsis acidiphila]|uniref:Uncharacterized protein n=1 Tax=Amycolatopsis acidiphila TaxID=715473 RepID=A0A558ANP2_9PSEU|nr:hypothetical protein FNH06_00020 [Amycolatopsis acidiphila]
MSFARTEVFVLHPEISGATEHKWVRRYREEGEAGQVDRSSLRRTSPRRTMRGWSGRSRRIRRQRRLGRTRIAVMVGSLASTARRN